MRRSRSLQLAPSQPEVDEACYAQQPLARKKLPSTSQPPAGHDHQEEPDKQLDFLSRLPIELALYILLKLAQHNDPRHLLSARAVSKSWQRLAEDSLIWKQSFLSQPTWTITTTTTNNNHHHHQPPIPRRLSQLIGLAQPTPHWTATSEAAPQLNWLKLFRDRYIIDRRWRHGSQLSKKLKGHKDSVYCLQMHDQQIITGSRDRTIKVWDSRSRECQRTLLGHKGSVLCVRFDAELLLSGSSDSSVLVWDRASWTVVRELVGHRSGVLDLGLTSTVFVSCSKDTTIKIWNRPDGALLRTITGHTGPVNALELSLQPLATLLNQPDPSPSSPPLSNALLSASGDSSMKLWDTHSGLLIRTFDGHLRGLACLKLVEHLRQIITGSNDETIKIWNLLTGQCLRTLLGHSGLVRSLDFSLRHNRLVSGSYDKTIKVWDLATGQLLLDFRKGTDRSLVFDVKFNLTSIVFVGHPNSIMLLDFADGLEADMFD